MISFIVDCETTGIPARREVITSPSYPHLVEIAGLLVDDDEKELASFDLIVRPDGWEIPDEAAAVHGISQEKALLYGVPLRVAVAVYTNLLRTADRVAGHNLEYDIGIISAAIYRAGGDPARYNVVPNPTCTAILGEPIAKLPATQRMIDAGFGDKFKKPNLGELYKSLFGEAFANAHTALADCRAAARILFEIERRTAA